MLKKYIKKTLQIRNIIPKNAIKIINIQKFYSVHFVHFSPLWFNSIYSVHFGSILSTLVLFGLFSPHWSLSVLFGPHWPTIFFCVQFCPPCSHSVLFYPCCQRLSIWLNLVHLYSLCALTYREKIGLG